MSSLRRDLIEKRLWPLVVILIAAIVAVPFLLARRSNADVAVIPSVPIAAGGSQVPAVNGAGSGKAVSVSAERRQLHRLTKAEIKREAERNPFTVTPTRTSNSTTTSSSISTSASTTSTDASAASAAAGVSSPTEGVTSTTDSPATIGDPTTVTAASGGNTPSDGSPTFGGAPGTRTSTVTETVTQTSTATATTPTTSTATMADGPVGDGPWTIYSVDVRTAKFNSSTHKLGPVTSHHDLARLSPLPSVASSKLMFTGVTDHGHEAVFALGDGVDAKGAGRCLPDASVCSAIALPEGAVESLTWYDADGSVDERALSVSRLVGTTTDSQSQAAAAFARHSHAGQCELDLAQPLQYDDTKGSVSAASSTDCKGIKSAVPFPESPSGS